MPRKRKLPKVYELPTTNLDDLRDDLANAISTRDYQMNLLGQRHAIERAEMYARLKSENQSANAGPAEMVARHKAELAEVTARHADELAACKGQATNDYAARRAAATHDLGVKHRGEKKEKYAEHSKYVEFAEINVALREREIAVEAAKVALDASIAARRPAQLAEIARLEAKEAAEREAIEAEKAERAARRAERD